ncbi:hypothetical protein T484DRAFT_1770098, partial [Baffinella frigidus]
GKWEEDPYLVLGVPVSAQAKDIRKAYRTLSLKLHPDKAYRTLSLKLHPDKLQGVGADAGLRDLAKVAFMDVVAAYEFGVGVAADAAVRDLAKVAFMDVVAAYQELDEG